MPATRQNTAERHTQKRRSTYGKWHWVRTRCVLGVRNPGCLACWPWQPLGCSERETEVLEAIGAHLSNAQIAGRMHISVRTVESHVSSLLRKFGVPDRRALAELAPVVTTRQQAGTGMVVGL